MNKHINHIAGMIPPLLAKAKLYRQFADDCDTDTGSKARNRWLDQALFLETEAAQLKLVLIDILNDM